MQRASYLMAKLGREDLCFPRHTAAFQLYMFLLCSRTHSAMAHFVTALTIVEVHIGEKQRCSFFPLCAKLALVERDDMNTVGSFENSHPGQKPQPRCFWIFDDERNFLLHKYINDRKEFSGQEISGEQICTTFCTDMPGDSVRKNV